MHLSKDLKEFVACLNSERVEYLVVGALAVSWHGFPRYSADLDLFVRRSEENAARLVEAIRKFGFGSLGLASTDFLALERVIQIGAEPNRIDLLTSLTGIEFEDAWVSRMPGEVSGLQVNFIGRDALLLNKRATGRVKDKLDADELDRLKRS